MASEDVIELGSSDEESEPAAKRIKPTPNAMVHIPHPKLSGVTIKPARPSHGNALPKSLLAGKPITVTKVVNPFAARKKNICGQVSIIPIRPTNSRPQLQKVPGNTGILKIMKTTDPPVSINKLSGISKQFRNSVKERQNTKTLSKLPSGITVKRTLVNATLNKANPTFPPEIPILRTIATNQKLIYQNKPNSIQIKKNLQREVLTVELDDDEVSTSSTASPQWYLRPEEQTEMENIEYKNNEEPNSSNFIEITIEDSPVKALAKRTHEVGAELAITIDDSPVKSLPNEHKSNATESDEEKNESKKDPHSKKKLEYPKDVVEIEIDGMEIDNTETQNNMEERIQKETAKDNEGGENIVEIQESPIKVAPNSTVNNSEKSPSKPKNINTSTPKKVTLSPKEQENNMIQSKTESEFHPAYQQFIDLCFEIENSDDMKKIVEKKIKAYYRQVPKDYTESEEFIDMVSSKILSMKAGPEKMYLYIKDVVDELNLQRKMAKSQVPKENDKVTEPEKLSYGEDSEYDSKRQRQIRKLEKTLKKLHRAIQKLEEQEVDFDDEEDSVYLLTERYKERMVRVHAKFCQLTNTKMPSEPRIHIESRPGRASGPAKRLEKWVNRKVPIGTPLPFPDFHDVLKCVREANAQDKLGWNEADIMEEARDLFTRCGKKLQRRRQENEWRLAASRISVDIDPAEDSSELKTKLEKNRQVAAVREFEVLDKYADRQNKLKLEAEEIGDKEADQSTAESDDEEPMDEAPSLENKEKRKERLKRLLQEKSKKPIEEKENQPTKSNEENASDIEMIETDVKESKIDTEKESVIEEQVSSLPLGCPNEDKKETEITENVERSHSISDDNCNVESDIDELHLLQKLHSSEVNTSTLESSDSESPIAISDTLESGSDNKEKRSSDVISIENSSYSESENKDTSDLKNNKEITPIKKKVIEDLININVEIECSTAGIEKKNVTKINNDEYNESIEDILLASSDDDENGKAQQEDVEELSDGNGCINFKDDALSIGDTVVQETVSNKNENNATDINDLDSDASKGREITDSSSVESVVIVSTNDVPANEKGLNESNIIIAENSVVSLPATQNESDHIGSKTKKLDEVMEGESQKASNNSSKVIKDFKSIDSRQQKVSSDEIQNSKSESRIESMEVDNNEQAVSSIESTNVETIDNNIHGYMDTCSPVVVESVSSDENLETINTNNVKIIQSPVDGESTKSELIKSAT